MERNNDSMSEMLRSIGEKLTEKEDLTKKFLGNEDNTESFTFHEPFTFNEPQYLPLIFDIGELFTLLNDPFGENKEKLTDEWERIGVIKKGTENADNIAMMLTEYRLARLQNDPVLEVIEQLMRLFTEETDNMDENIPFLLDPFMFSVIRSLYSRKEKKIPMNFDLLKDCLLLSLKAFKEDYYDKYKLYLVSYMTDEDSLTEEEKDDATRLYTILETTKSPLFAFTVSCNLRENMSDGLVPYFTTGSDGKSRIEIHSRKRKRSSNNGE